MRVRTCVFDAYNSYYMHLHAHAAALNAVSHVDNYLANTKFIIPIHILGLLRYRWLLVASNECVTAIHTSPLIKIIDS